MAWWSGVMALAVALVFANCLANAFVWDDEQFVVKNVFLTSPRFLIKLITGNIVAGSGLVSNMYRPLQSLTHFVDVQLWGYRPWAHHLTTVLFHIAASVAVFRLLARLVPAPAAGIAAALFALHPLQSEAVAYACGRGDGLAILFICLGLLAFRRHLGWSLFLAALGMASKEHAVMFPALLFCYDRASPPTTPLRRHLPFWWLSAAYVIARLTVLNFANTLNFYNQPNVLTEHYAFRVYTYLTTIPKGWLLWFWPFDLHHERSWPVYASFAIPRVWGSALAILGLAAAAWGLRKRARAAAMGIAWFFVATIPTSNLLVLINALFYDHWFILPGVGLAMAMSDLISRLLAGPRWRRVATAAVSVTLLIMLAQLTRRHNGIWRSPVTLYRYILSWEPNSAKIHNNLAMAYAERGSHAEAIAFYQRAIALNDEFPQTHYNLSGTYWELGRATQAIEELKRALAITSDFHQAWIRLGAIYASQRQLADAKQAFQRAIRAYPYDATAYLNLAAVCGALGESAAARSTLQEGLARLPDDASLQAAYRSLTTDPTDEPPSSQPATPP